MSTLFNAETRLWVVLFVGVVPGFTFSSMRTGDTAGASVVNYRRERERGGALLSASANPTQFFIVGYFI